MRPALLTTALLLAACNPAPAPEAPPGTLATSGDVVLTADGHPIHQEVVDLALSRMPAEQLEQMKAGGEYKQLLEKMAVGEALWRQAVERKLYEDPEVQMKVAMAARDTLAQALLEDVAEAAITDEKIQEAYDARKVRYAKPSADVSLIILQDEAKATEVKGMIDGGADFAEVAAAYSIDPQTAQQGGSLGRVNKGDLKGDLDTALFGEGSGEGVIGPISAGGVFFVVKSENRRDVTPLDEVRDDIVRELEQEEVQKYVTTLESELEITWTGEEAAPAAEAASTAEAAPAAEAPAHGEPGHEDH